MRHTTIKRLCFWALLIGLNFGLKAQTNDSIPIITSESEIEEVVPEKVHSPHKASIYSAVFPGLGQIYNRKYWKLPLVYGGIGGMAYAIHFNTKYYKIYRSAYRDFIIGDPGNTSYVEVIPPGLTMEDVNGSYKEWFTRALESKKRYYKRYRDLSYIGMTAFYLLNIIDASIDAHFYNFDISQDLSMRVEPAFLPHENLTGGALGLQVKFQF